MAWAGPWRVRKTIRSSKKKYLQGQLDNTMMRNTRGSGRLSIKAPLRRLQSHFKTFLTSQNTAVGLIWPSLVMCALVSWKESDQESTA